MEQIYKILKEHNVKNLKEITLEEVSKYVFLSPKYLSRLFQDEMDITFKTYISNQKISRVKNLVRYTNKSFTDIGLAIGISSSNNFAAYFKKHTGLTPKEFRNMSIN